MAALLYISNIRALDLPDNYDRAYCLLSDECKEKTDQYKITVHIETITTAQQIIICFLLFIVIIYTYAPYPL